MAEFKNGYRNICYSYDQNRNGLITLFHWDKHGKPVKTEIPHASYLYEVNKNGADGVSIFGDPLMRREFANSSDKRKFIEARAGTRFFDSFSPAKEFLMENFEGINNDQQFLSCPLRINFLDIEVAIEEEFPDPKEAKYPINVITCFDSLLNEYHCFHTGKTKYDPTDKFWTSEIHHPVVFHHAMTEEMLLSNFLTWFSKNHPDILATYNGLTFDVPYIVNRLYNVFGRDEAAMDSINQKLSPIGRVRQKMKQLRKNGQNIEEVTFQLEGISHLDLLILYRDKFQISKLSSFSLGYVAEYELGVTKIEYEGSMRDFYRRDFQKFVLYNIRDVELLVKLEAKCQLIALTRFSCYQALCEFESIYTSSGINLGVLAQFAHRQNLRIMTDNGIEDINRGDYEGALVLDTRVGAYREGIAMFDVNSLYPNTMITLNLSPETKLGRLDMKPDERGLYRVRLSSGKCYEMNEEQRKELLSKCVCAPNGVLFCKHSKKRGIIPQFCETLYAERKATQKILKERKAELKETIDKVRKAELESVCKFLYLKQLSLKNTLNSQYGLLASVYFPLYDIDNAAAITAGGRHILEKSVEFINSKLGYDAVIFGDTDSVAINVGPYLKSENINFRDLDHAITACDKLGEELNQNAKVICARDFGSEVVDRIKFGRELYGDGCIPVAPKCYIIHLLDNEGVRCDEWKIKGIEIKKTALPKRINDLLSALIKKSVIREVSKTEFQDDIRAMWDIISIMGPEEIAPWKGYTTEKVAPGFLATAKGSTNTAKAAAYYNQIIEKLDLKGKYPEIMPGKEKIRVLRIKPTNHYGINVIAFTEKYPEEFRSLFSLDYPVMFDKMILKPLEKFIQINGWSKFKAWEEAETNIFDL